MDRAVIFDLDGVLVDTAEFHYRGWKRLADELGVPFDERANDKIRGVPRRESLLSILGYNPGENLIAEYSDRKNQYYLEMVNSLTPSDLLPGVSRLLQLLRQAGYKMAVASSSKNAPLVLRLLRLENAFDAVVDGNEITSGKPAPDLFLRAAGKMSADPAGCVVVEDAESGVQAAHAAGMLALGIGSPGNLPDAERVVRGLDQVSAADFDQLLAERVRKAA